MSISTPAWTSTSFFPLPDSSRLAPPPVRKKGTLSGNPIKGVREFSAKPERSRPELPYLIVKQTSAAENPGLRHPVYRYVPVLYLRRSHIWIGAHHIPSVPFYLSTTALYRYVVCIRAEYRARVSILYLAKYRMGVVSSRRLEEMLCCRMSYSTSRIRAGLLIATVPFIRNSDCSDFVRRLAVCNVKW